MRRQHVFALFVALAVGCYNTGDLGDAPFRCQMAYPDCPDGYVCSYTLGQCAVPTNCTCVRSNLTTSALEIPKNGMYTGPHMDPGLSTCHETDANNGFQSAFVIGDSTGLFDGLEICPPGDIDVYALNLDSGEYAKVVIKYQIEYGDLDLQILDVNGKPVLPNGRDNDATHDNACVTISKNANCPCTYYAIVDGAGNTAVNRYTIQMTKASTPLSCQAAPPPDMSTGF
jgi:hypothetical protein